jgi:exosortase
VRSASFGLLVVSALAVFWVPLTALVKFSFRQEHYSHLILIPLISTALVILERRGIFARAEPNRLVGSTLLAAGVLLYVFGRWTFGPLGENDQLSAVILAFVVIILGSFVLCYGLRAARSALFPLLFLFLMVPIPEFVLDRAIVWLQTGSADVSEAIFELIGVPVFRAGFVFSLPGVTVEVAKECSGIRSSLALLITSLLAGHFMLRSVWAKATLTLATLPLLVIKNGVRIVTLSLLSSHDPRFLTGSLHRQGGVVFFILGLALLAAVLLLLQKAERSGRTSASLHI